MVKDKTELQKRIDSGKPIVIAEISPPKGSDPEPVRACAKRYAGKVNAIGISDNRNGTCMSALAAASLVAAEGVEPILHMVTRDRNRIALISNCIGADALGIRNILLTSGTHQTLGNFKTARNVFDIDSLQILSAITGLADDGTIVGEDGYADTGPYCLGAVAAPFADPAEMQLMRLSKKVKAGAQFMITQPIFDLERFRAWWEDVTQRGLHEKAAIIAEVRLLLDADDAKELSEQRPSPMIPKAMIDRISSESDKASQRKAGIEIAVETIKELSSLDGLRGFEICAEGDDEAGIEIIEKSGLEIS